MLPSEGKLLVVTFVIFILSQDFTQVKSAATFITSREGWASSEFSNVTLDCRVIISGGPSHYFSCPTISFTRNETIIDRNPRYVRSGPTFDVNNVICTMTILHVQSEDSGLYGCCLTDKTSGLCYKHPTKMLSVISHSTTVQTTFKVTSSVATDASTTMKTTTLTQNNVSSVNVTYNKVTNPSLSNSSLSKSDNTAHVQHTKRSRHLTIWPVFLVATLAVVILVILGVRHFRKKPTDESLPENLTDVTAYHTMASNQDVEKG